MKMIVILSFLSHFWFDIANIKKSKELKKKMREELMPIAWHSRRWWNFYMSEDEEIKK